MKKIFVTVAVLLPGVALSAQTTVAEPTGQKSLAATISVQVFPAQGQPKDQQNMDEAACYRWAVENTATDPFELAEKAEIQAMQADSAKQQAAQTGRGAGAAGAIGGAAVGALVGEIASDDPGAGAAWGAAAGAIGGRRRARRSRQEATAAVDAQAAQHQAATAAQVESFKKAFSVCLEAKEYMVKF